MRLDELMVPAVYLAISFVWLLLATKIPQLLPQPTIPSRKLRWVRNCATVVAAVLSLDATYWMVANLSRHGFLADSNGALNEAMRTPWLVICVKSLLLLAAVSFFFVLKAASPALLNETEMSFFSRFVEYTWDAVCITDANGKVKHWNQGAANLFGFSKTAVENRELKEFLIPEQLHEESDRIWEQIQATRLAKTDYHTLRHTSTGGLIPIDVSISPIFDGAKFNGYFGIMRETATNPRTRYFKKSRAPQRQNPYAFVAMPFSSTVVRPDVWEVAIKEGIDATGLEPVRGDTESLPEQIIDQVYYEIVNAKIVIADLTEFSSNVLYELGIAHGLDKPVVQITSSRNERLPFDIQGIRTIFYDPEDLSTLRKQLTEAIQRQLAAK